MRGPTTPYLYSNQQERYKDPFSIGFDPKAVTRASWAPPPAPRPRQDGPLLNFNRHPDSWQQAPYGSINAIPMPRNTKRNVKAVRWVQLILRVISLIGAAGTTVCMAMLSNIHGIATWATRAAPAIDIAFALYSIFHLARRAKYKAPQSAASYHLFAILMDVTLIPFYVYVALSDRWNISQPIESKARWTSLLQSQTFTNDLIDYTWIVAIIVGSVHLLSSTVSLYLARMFRKIANLPPDLNPLEDNLTSRRKSKHKYKDSDIIMASESLKHKKQDSGISLPWEDEKRPVSFISTRNEMGQLYSPHNPRTANASRASLPILYPGSADTHPSSPVSAPSMRSKTSTEGLARTHAEFPGQTSYSAESPLKQSTLGRMNSLAASSVYSDRSSKSNGPAPVLPRKSSKRASGTFTTTENWSVFRNKGENDENSEQPFSVVPEEEGEGEEGDDMFGDDNHDRSHTQPYQLVRQSSFLEGDDLGISSRSALTIPPKSPAPPSHKQFCQKNILLAPLNMNPPTPPPQAAAGDTSRPSSRNSVSAVSLTSYGDTPIGTPTMGRYYSNIKHGHSRFNTSNGNDSAIVPLINRSGTATPPRNPLSPTKSRYYGDLQSAVQGVRSSPQSSPKSKRPQSYPTKEPVLMTNEWLAPARRREDEKRRGRREREGHERMHGKLDNKARVVSRSGVDLGDGTFWEDAEPEWQQFGGNGARNVSGKVVEEGRGGWARRRISGMR